MVETSNGTQVFFHLLISFYCCDDTRLPCILLLWWQCITFVSVCRNGLLQNVKYVQRVSTVRGLPPPIDAVSAIVGDEYTSPFLTIYWFYVWPLFTSNKRGVKFKIQCVWIWLLHCINMKYNRNFLILLNCLLGWQGVVKIFFFSIDGDNVLSIYFFDGDNVLSIYCLI